jgi:hypothetical protein
MMVEIVSVLLSKARFHFQLRLGVRESGLSESRLRPLPLLNTVVAVTAQFLMLVMG